MRKVTSCMVMAAALTLAAPPAAAAALDCSAAVEVELGQAYDGDNTGLPDNVSMYACSDWDESGGEVVHHLHLERPHDFTVSLASECDLDLAVLDACDEVVGCLQVVSDTITTTSPMSGDFYFVVDGYEGAGCAFTLALVDDGVANEDLSLGRVKAFYGRQGSRVR